MLVILLLSSCFFHKLDERCKGKREDISRAIKLGATERLRLLLGAGMVNEKDADDLTPLHEAAETGNLGALAMPVKQGADTNEGG